MSLPSIKKSPANSAASCPDCGATLSRQADINRHRKTKHSDGTETKFPCPVPGCRYKAMQKGNLKAHVDARHSNGPKYHCPECEESFGDAPARIRHRKINHGYEPYHTEEYLERQSLKGNGKAPQGVGKAVSTTTRSQRAAGAAPYSSPHTPSSDALSPGPESFKFYYHDDLWNTLIDMARYYAENPERLQDLQVSLPLAINPGSDTSDVIQALPDTSTEPVAPSLFPLGPTSDNSTFPDPLDAILSQGQMFSWPSTQDNTSTAASAAGPSNSASLLWPTGIDMNPLTSAADSHTYTGMDLQSQFQESPTSSDGDVLPPMQDPFSFPTMPAISSQPADLQLPFMPTSYEPADPVSGPSTSSTPSLSLMTPTPQIDFFTSGKTIPFDFDGWCLSHLDRS